MGEIAGPSIGVAGANPHINGNCDVIALHQGDDVSLFISAEFCAVLGDVDPADGNGQFVSIGFLA